MKYDYINNKTILTITVNNHENRIPSIPKPSNQVKRRGSPGHFQNAPVLIMREVNEIPKSGIIAMIGAITFSMTKECK